MAESNNNVDKPLLLSLNLTVKRGREEIEFASKETEKLYNLIASGQSSEWATKRIERIQEMILFPSYEHIKQEVLTVLRRTGHIE